MRTTPLTASLSITNAALWGVSLIESTRKAEGLHLEPLGLLAASPLAVAASAALTVSLVVWRVLGPLVVVWRAAEQEGRDKAERAHVTLDLSNVHELHPHA